MQTKNKNNPTIKKTPQVMIVLIVALVLLWQQGDARSAESAESISQLSNEQSDRTKSDNQEKLAELERRAQLYREIIEIKRKQQNSLSSQLSVMDTQLEQVETEIEANKRKIAELDGKIKSLQEQIGDKEKTLLLQKKILAELIASYYETSQQNIFNVVFTSGSLTSFMSHKDLLAQASDKIKQMTDAVASMREKMLQDRSELDKKRVDIVNVHYDLADKNSLLESTQIEKKALLEQTRGEEARYSQLLARVEEQKLQLLDIDELYATSGLSIDDFPKPDASLNASLAWYFSQKDPRWANMNIGNSTSLMKSYGCAVSAVAMVFASHGSSDTPKTLVKQPIFSWDLISWPQSWPAAKLTMNSYGMAHGNINWSEIDKEIKKDHPVIVYLKKTNGKGGHYVVVHHKDSKSGKYVVHDPYFGPNIFLDTSKALVGAMGASSGVSMDQMIIYN